MGDREAVKIFSAQDNIQAEMIIEAFRNNQIPAYKKDVGASSIMNLYSGNSIFGEEIFVASEDAQRAKEILQDMGYETEKCD